MPNEALITHSTVYPIGEKFSCLRVVRGVLKSRSDIPLFHVFFSNNNGSIHSSQNTLSIFRSNDHQEAIDLCNRCCDCKALFTLLG